MGSGIISARSRLDLTHTIVLSQQSEFSVTRDLNYSKLTLYRLQTVAIACSKVYQVTILMVCSPSKANEDSQRTVTVRSAHSLASLGTSQSTS